VGRPDYPTITPNRHTVFQLRQVPMPSRLAIEADASFELALPWPAFDTPS
jgi:hypothetical protein